MLFVPLPSLRTSCRFIFCVSALGTSFFFTFLSGPIFIGLAFLSCRAVGPPGVRCIASCWELVCGSSGWGGRHMPVTQLTLNSSGSALDYQVSFGIVQTSRSAFPFWRGVLLFLWALPWRWWCGSWMTIEWELATSLQLFLCSCSFKRTFGTFLTAVVQIGYIQKCMLSFVSSVSKLSDTFGSFFFHFEQPGCFWNSCGVSRS